MSDKVEVATVAITLKHPFWASLLFDKMKVQMDRRTPVAATNGSRIFLNPDNMVTRSNGEVVFIMCHEIAHAMLRHMERFAHFEAHGFEGAPFNRMVANVAADYVINALLKDCGVGTMPKDALWDSKYTGDMPWTEVYRDLMSQLPPPPPKKKPGEGKGGGDSEQNEGGGGDEGEDEDEQDQPEGQGRSKSQSKDKPGKGEPGSGPTSGDYEQQGLPKPMDEHLDPDPETEKDPAHSDEGWELAVAAAANAEKSRGDLPGSLARLVDNILNPRQPWQELLRAAISRKIGRDERTWRRPRRRSLVSSNIYLPGMTGHGSGTLAVFVDTSGSIGQDEFDVFCAELQGILTDAKPERVYVLFGDARVQSHVELEEWDEAREAFKHSKGGGGTRFEPFWHWLDKERIQPDTAVIFTDTYGSWPRETTFPLIVCSTTNEDSAMRPDFEHKFIFSDIHPEGAR